MFPSHDLNLQPGSFVQLMSNQVDDPSFSLSIHVLQRIMCWRESVCVGCFNRVTPPPNGQKEKDSSLNQSVPSLHSICGNKIQSLYCRSNPPSPVTQPEA